jgi:hypothetical protein
VISSSSSFFSNIFRLSLALSGRAHPIVIYERIGREWSYSSFVGRDVGSDGKRQEARGKRQEARGKRQEARGKRQEARGERSERRT